MHNLSSKNCRPCNFKGHIKLLSNEKQVSRFPPLKIDSNRDNCNTVTPDIPGKGREGKRNISRIAKRNSGSVRILNFLL